MPIEFHCTVCKKLLRTQDDTAGKQAKCPSCGTVLAIPGSGDIVEAHPREYGLPSDWSPAAPIPPLTGFSPSGIDQPYLGERSGGNPYQSPMYNMSSPVWPNMARTGPPWERDKRAIGSLLETVRLAYSSTAFFFSDMRREGGLGRPIAFALIAGSIGLFFQVALQLGIQFAIIGIALMNNPRPAGAPGPAEMAGMVCVLGFIPLFVLIGVFLQSGMYHLMLKMLHAAPFPFETTFRVVAYSMGAAFLLAAVPFCGHFIAWIVSIVFTIVGLSKAQEISGGKASAAVLIPIVLCCGTSIAGYIALLVMIFSQA